MAFNGGGLRGPEPIVMGRQLAAMPFKSQHYQAKTAKTTETTIEDASAPCRGSAVKLVEQERPIVAASLVREPRGDYGGKVE